MLNPGRNRVITGRFAMLANIARTSGHGGPLTETPPEAITRRHYIQRAILGAAPAIAASAPTTFLNSFVECNNIAAVQQAAAAGRGVVIAGTHFGSLGITPAVLAKKGFRVIILRDQQFARLLNTPHAEQFFLGAEPVFLDVEDPDSVSHALLRCARALREGAIIAYTADARHGNRSRKGTVFGQTVEIRTALLELAIRSKSAIVSGFSYVSGAKVQVDLSDPAYITSQAELDEWCNEFCRLWQMHLLANPSAISWHRTDLELVGDSYKIRT